MAITATWYEPDLNPDLVVLEIDRFAFPAITAELVEKIRRERSFNAGCEILPENIIYEALNNLATKQAWLAGMYDDRIKAETEAKEADEKKRLENEKVEKIFGGMVF